MIQLIILLALVGLLVWALTNFLPMDPKFAMLIRVVAIVLAVLYVLQAFGLFVLPTPRHL